MKLTPEQMAVIAHEVARAYGTAEEELIRLIVARLVDGAPVLPASAEAWRIEKLMQSLHFKKEALEILRAILGDMPLKIDKVLFQAAKAAIEDGEPLLQDAFDAGAITIHPREMFTVTGGISTKTAYMVQKYREVALDKMNMVNTSMLSSAQQNYIDILNVSTGMMHSGEVSPYVAIRTATKKLVQQGLDGFYDKAGRRWEPQSAVEMIVRTNGNHVANQATFSRMDEVGADLIIISAHLGARPKCYLDQGKIFSRSGRSGTVQDKNGNMLPYYDWNKSSYGQPDGILGINCRHHSGFFFEGLSENLQEEFDESENAKRYKLEQQQRQYERELRKLKRERDIAKLTGDEDAARMANAKVRAKSKQLRDHIEKHELRRSKVRERYVK